MTLEALIKQRPSLLSTECTFRYANCARQSFDVSPTAVIVVHLAKCPMAKDMQWPDNSTLTSEGTCAQSGQMGDEKKIRDLSGEPYKSHREHLSAKARLEAAAPDLLETLKALVKTTEDRDNIGDYGVSRDADEMIAARAAIKKVEGA